MTRGRRPGFTLVELVVVLAVLGVLAGVVAVAGRPAASPAQADPWRATVAAARARALATGHPVHVYAAGDVLALPDGSVLTDADPGGGHAAIDPFTGRPDSDR